MIFFEMSKNFDMIIRNKKVMCEFLSNIIYQSTNSIEVLKFVKEFYNICIRMYDDFCEKTSRGFYRELNIKGYGHLENSISR